MLRRKTVAVAAHERAWIEGVVNRALNCKGLNTEYPNWQLATTHLRTFLHGKDFHQQDTWRGRWGTDHTT